MKARHEVLVAGEPRMPDREVLPIDTRLRWMQNADPRGAPTGRDYRKGMKWARKKERKNGPR